MLNIENELFAINKKIRKDIILIIAFAILLATSILLFIFLSNYKVELLLSIVGSIVSSLLAVMLTFVICCLFILDKEKKIFLYKVDQFQENKITIQSIKKLDDVTLKRGIRLTEYLINENVYYLLNKELIIKKNDTLLCKGQYILGKVDE